jgi:glycosyltransferase involved in cell wall biosynthesis
MAPLVSILLPNLNNRPFLDERIESIRAQTTTDWELIVVDNHSEDGAWEFFQELRGREPRLRISQAPREGMYANWNNCVRLAAGRYVYIATSDDTMAPDCLEQMVDALESVPDADLAHCRLRIIDEKGRDAADWWWAGSIFARSSGELLHRRHVRRAPYDGLLHLSGESVYVSITQLLIRRSLFDRIGLFEPRWGSVGDFNWCMRAPASLRTQFTFRKPGAGGASMLNKQPLGPS